MAEFTIKQDFLVGSPARIKLNNISGSVVFEPGEEGKVHIQAVKHDNGNDDRVIISMSQSEDGEISISTQVSEFDFGWMFGTRLGEVDYLIKAPQNSNLMINGVSCSHKVSGFCGDIQLKTVSGGVILESLAGKIKLDSVSGDIFGKACKGTLQANVVSGDFNFEDSELSSTQVSTVSGDVCLLTPLAQEGPYKFNSVSGDITLLVPPDTSCRTEIHSMSGELSTNLPGDHFSHQIGSKTANLGGGGVLVTLNSVSGDLRIKSSEVQKTVPDKSSSVILSKLENGEISVDEAIAQLNS